MTRITATSIPGSIIDHQGKLRPWPVLNMSPDIAAFVDRAARERGTSFADVFGAVREVVPNASFHEQFFAHAMAEWHLSGRQSFKVAPLLLEALGDTNLSKVPSDAIRSPYPAVWIEAPVRLGASGPEMVGFFLLETTAGHLGEVIDLYRRFDPADRVLRVVAVGQEQQIFITDIGLPDGEIEDAIADAAHGKGTEEEKEVLWRVWALVSNILLYLSSPDPDVQNVLPQGIRIKNKLSGDAMLIQAQIRRREGYLRQVGFRLTRIRKGSPPEQGEGQGESGHQIASHLVRGHWKRQPHGPRQQERKWIWIAPYRRGEGTEERLERTYDL